MNEATLREIGADIEEISGIKSFVPNRFPPDWTTQSKRKKIEVAFLVSPKLSFPLSWQLWIPKELQKAGKERQRLSAIGRIAANLAIQRLLGETTNSFFLAMGKGGEPIWPNGIVGSITHTQGFASACVALASEMKSIGIDTERIDRSSKEISRLIEKIIHPEENFFFTEKNLPISTVERFIFLFSAKESVFKAIYPLVKRFFGFQAVRLVSIQFFPIRAPSCTVVGQFYFSLNEELSPLFSMGTILEGSFSVSPPYIHTVVWI